MELTRDGGHLKGGYMSRTYHHGYKWGHKVRARCKHLQFEGKNYYYNKDGSLREVETYLGFFSWTEPKEWRKKYKHKPHRARTRKCLHKLRKGADPDDMTWPISGRPWIYYW